MSDKMREALERLADACDVVGVKYFDTDTMDDEVQAMQTATRDARAALAEQPAQASRHAEQEFESNARQIDARSIALAREARLEVKAKLNNRIAELEAEVERLKQPAQGEAVCRTDGRCQYAIDHGAEGLGFCPKGKCAMPAQGEAAARIRTRTKDSQFTGKAEQHAELIHWENGIDALPDGVHLLYTAPPAPAVPDDVAEAARYFKTQGGHIGGLGVSRAANILWDYINDVLAAAPEVKP